MTGALACYEIEHDRSPFPGGSMTSTTRRARPPRESSDCGVHHPHVHAMQRPVDPGVVQGKPPARRVVSARRDARPRGLSGLSETMAILVPTRR